MNDDLEFRLTVAQNEITRLRAVIVELEAALALARGTLAQPEPADGAPAVLVDEPPNAPR